MWDIFDVFLKSLILANVLCFKVKINNKTKKVNHIAIVQIKQHIEHQILKSTIRTGWEWSVRVLECGHRESKYYMGRMLLTLKCTETGTILGIWSK